MVPSAKQRMKGKPTLGIHWLASLPVPFTFDAFLDPTGAPVEIEFGTGRGAFLCQEAASRPHTRFLGIDYDSAYLHVAARRLHVAGCRNVALFFGHFECLVSELPPSSIQAFHIYFPDPWHKKRHTARRVIRPDLLHWMHHALSPGGRIHLRTDVVPLYEEWQTELAAVSAAFDIVESFVYTSIPRPDWHPTNYERRFLEDGLPCHAITVRKREAPAT